MATKIFPISIEQNPSSVKPTGQQWIDACREQVEKILDIFLEILPSSYVSQVVGPHYTIQFQAAAEQIAKIQLIAQEFYSDSDFQFTRPEFLFQILGSLVFPDTSEGVPRIDGDVSYREFLRRMVSLLLQGSTKQAVLEGLRLVIDGDVEIIEKVIAARETGNPLWNLKEQFQFEVNVGKDGGTAFPTDPITTQDNAYLVLQALKPAHALYQYRHLFQETFGDLFSDELSWEMKTYHYEDFRKFCQGIKQISSNQGETLSDVFLFHDTSVSFSSVLVGSVLEILSGANVGVYRVEEILYLPFPTDTTPRNYITSPTGITGKVTVLNNAITDVAFQNIGAVAVEGEVMTILEGPNAGTYRLDIGLGPTGGKIGFITDAYSVLPSPGILRLDKRMTSALTGQTYTVVIDRLGVKTPQIVTNEDVSQYFYL